MSKASQEAYRKIRAGILSGHFPAGQFVPEDEFAQYCGLSRTPVREAIAELVAEMLLQRSDTNRVFVPVWSDDDDEELFTLRAMLESHCASRAARLITDDQIARLRAHCDFIDRAIAAPGGPDVSGFVEGNRHFHDVILAAAQSERLAQLMKFVVSQIVVHRTAEQYSRADMEQSQRDHRDLVSAFELHDADWARAVANTHIRRAASVYRAMRQGAEGSPA
ncbi:MAG: GntR family transcriptional regulator [Novosphingobium meiothermophilum]